MQTTRTESMSQRWGMALGIWMALAGAAPAQATVTQPNGQNVPITGRLQAYLNGSAANNNINEGVDEQRDAQTQPEKFSPLCDFSGRYVAKGGGANFAIGWYNVDDRRADNSPPRYVPVDTGANLNTAAANSDIILLFPFSASLPTGMLDLNSMSIRSHARYQGGLIGFALVPNPTGTGNGNATQYHYTEKRFSTYCSLCSNPGYWISTVIYRSNQLANTFYLGFEDLDFTNAAGNNGVNGNDLDYEDFLFRFTGVACVGAGKACTDPTKQGACQAGVTECDAQGKIYCKAIATASNERCDGIDNNCDGQVDEGDLCPNGLLCSRGACVGLCHDEAPCPGGQTCDRGRCIDSACAGVNCGATQACQGGNCVDPCSGVSCPAPTVCSAGLCVDPCTNSATGEPVSCGANKACVNGACVPSCLCLPCDAGLSCQASTGLCVQPACVNVTCGTGEKCLNGSCVSACTDAICPAGQVCQAGRCQDVTQTTDPNGTDQSGGAAAVATGCSCREAPGQQASGAWALFATVTLLGWAVTRRRSLS